MRLGSVYAEPLQYVHIEMVRKWRNQPQIRQWMEFTQHITPEAQQQWFERLDTHTQFYFVFSELSVPVGLMHVVLPEPGARKGDAGIFVGNLTYLGTAVVGAASKLLIQFCRETLCLEQITAKIHVQNQVAKRYNQHLGFQFSHALSPEFDCWILPLK